MTVTGREKHPPDLCTSASDYLPLPSTSIRLWTSFFLIDVSDNTPCKVEHHSMIQDTAPDRMMSRQQVSFVPNRSYCTTIVR